MKKLKIILIDNESSNLKTLKQNLLNCCPDIELVAECTNGEEGIKSIEEKNADIVFLNIEMPGMNGFTMLEKLSNRNFELIFTTTYDHYVIHAIHFSALDFLVKPIELQELKAALNRVKEKGKQPGMGQYLEMLLYDIPNGRSFNNLIGIHSMQSIEFVAINDIIFLEAASNYTHIYLQSFSSITASKTLKDFETLLPPSVFVRIHHSWIINKNYVNKYLRGEGGQVIMSNGKTLDVSRRKKDVFRRVIGC